MVKLQIASNLKKTLRRLKTEEFPPYYTFELSQYCLLQKSFLIHILKDCWGATFLFMYFFIESAHLFLLESFTWHARSLLLLCSKVSYSKVTYFLHWKSCNFWGCSINWEPVLRAYLLCCASKKMAIIQDVAVYSSHFAVMPPSSDLSCLAKISCKSGKNLGIGETFLPLWLTRPLNESWTKVKLVKWHQQKMDGPVWTSSFYVFIAMEKCPLEYWFVIHQSDFSKIQKPAPAQ